MNEPPVNAVPEPEKAQVRAYWERQSCDTWEASSRKHSLAYFEEIENYRYYDQPFIHAFAQFTRYRGQRVLEVGFGAGTDFIQWLRAGALVSGVDLTQEALDNLAHRIAAYALPPPQSIQVADAENLPFASGSFDLGYSFGVLHHTPNPRRALEELVRVIRPGGEFKVMLYNRRSIWVFNQWLKHAVARGRPWKSPAWVAARHIESPGTRVYSRGELSRMCGELGLTHVRIHTEVVSADWLAAAGIPPLKWLYRLALRLAGWRFSWRPEQFAAQAAAKGVDRGPLQQPGAVYLTGNPLGFYHCITARKPAEAAVTSIDPPRSWS